MLTVLYRADDGNETVYNDVDTVQCIRHTVNDLDGPAGVRVNCKDGGTIHYPFIPPNTLRRADTLASVVIVMNENGRTVAKYEL